MDWFGLLPLRVLTDSGKHNERTLQGEKEDRRFRVGVLENSTGSIVDGEKDQHIDHQTGVDTGVKGDKGYIKLLWTHGESRRDGG